MSWLTQLQRPTIAGNASATSSEPGQVLVERVSAFLYYTGRLLDSGNYRITKIEFDITTGTCTKTQATGPWDDRATLIYLG